MFIHKDLISVSFRLKLVYIFVKTKYFSFFLFHNAVKTLRVWWHSHICNSNFWGGSHFTVKFFVWPEYFDYGLNLLRLLSKNSAYCDWFFHNIDIKKAFPKTSSCMLMKIFCCKILSTLFTNKLFFPSRKYHVFVHYHLSRIGLSTLNAPTDKWFFVFGWLSSPCLIKNHHALPCLLSK